MSDRAPARPAAAHRLAAAGVHLLTASGVLWALLALRAIEGGRFDAALVWMAIALAVDGVDGMLARRVGVSRVLPQIDGPLLDNLVDYLNYVIVPAWLVYRSDLLPGGTGFAAATAMGLASAYQFSQREAKTDDHFFRGFPSYWNLVAFYLLVLRLDPRLALALVALLCTLVFVPLRWVYPSRTRPARRLTLVLSAVWAVVLGMLILQYPACDPWLVRASLAYPIYYGGLSLLLEIRRRAPGPTNSPRAPTVGTSEP